MERTIELLDGIARGDGTEPIKTLVIRAPTAGDLIDAQEASERPVATPAGWKLLASNYRVGIEIVRRQVKRIGDDSGPMEMAQLKKMSSRDLDLVQDAANALDSAMADVMLEETENRGRDSGASADAATD